MQAPFFPIIYVRGYAMTASERDETAADPFCGFNMGSTVYRAQADRSQPPRKFVFESPMLRLAGDFDYADVYENGNDILDPDWEPQRGQIGIAARSVVVYRYYDGGSNLLGDGQARPIPEYAKGLGELILKVRELVQAREGAEQPFRCYLVAHSMGGLIVRSFLQDASLSHPDARAAVDKVFTYATPHNGIEVLGVNVPGWLGAADINNFDRDKMAGYLKLKPALDRYKRVDFLPSSAFPIDRFFCMIGTNRSDYEAAAGLSRTFVGNGSDGLVKIANASVWGLDDAGQVTDSAPVAFAYRSHSGTFGIVNAEESYQNLVRFLFGDVRVDIWLQIEDVQLPAALVDKKVNALYQFELLARPRGKRWYLSRRVSEEDSPACRTHAQLTDPAQPGARMVYLSTVFLANRAKVSQNDRTLAYQMDLRVRVPDYEVERRFWPDSHYEGSYLFNDALRVVLEPPAAEGGAWQVSTQWQSSAEAPLVQQISGDDIAKGKVGVNTPFASPRMAPGLRGQVLLMASAWR
jgi:hypothetical protein